MEVLGKLPVLSTVTYFRHARESGSNSLTCVCPIAAAQFRLYPSRIDEHLSVRSSLICAIRRKDKLAMAIRKSINEQRTAGKG